MRGQGVDTQFSVGVAVGGPVRAAIVAAVDWIPALNGDGSLRDDAQITELTSLIDP